MAWALACLTFPLIWIGGLVTTYGAGMAVPDWPNTYGYNLFLYPLASWLRVWDVLLEHSHRLIAATAGIVTILVACALWAWDQRRWMKWLAAAAVAGVCLQGALGGLRVIQNEILLAMLHGCTAPLFFSLSAALVTFTSARWQQIDSPAEHPAAERLQRLAVLTALGVYLQIVLGAQLRHLPLGGGSWWLTFWVCLHLIVAGLDLLCALALVILARRAPPAEPTLVRRARFLFWLLVVQLVLGASTWVAKYGWPRWFSEYVWAIEYTVVAGGRLRAAVVTAHVAVGALALVAALSLTLWSMRLVRFTHPTSLVRTTAAAAAPRLGLAVVKDYWQLARPRILAMVLATMAVAALVSGPTRPAWGLLVCALVGAGLVMVGAITLNQQLERRSDAKMLRTADRPLPAGRLTDRQARLWGLLTTALGLVWLGWWVNGTIAALAAASWLIYVWVYTPLKLSTAWQTPIGAVAGAMPVLLGAAVTQSPLSPVALTLFGIVYFWQFPHAMAIAWLGRREFAAADLKVATVVDPSGRTAGLLAMLGAAMLPPIGALPWCFGVGGWPYAASVLLLGLAYLGTALRFRRCPEDTAARWMLRMSLVYLVGVLLAVVLAVTFAQP